MMRMALFSAICGAWDHFNLICPAFSCNAELMFGQAPRNSIQTNLGLWWSLIFSSPSGSSRVGRTLLFYIGSLTVCAETLAAIRSLNSGHDRAAGVNVSKDLGCLIVYVFLVRICECNYDPPVFRLGLAWCGSGQQQRGVSVVRKAQVDVLITRGSTI